MRVHIVAGFPCKDTSRLKTQRMNLEGRHSGLFSHVVAVRSWLTAKARVPVHILVENVVMDREPKIQISLELRCRTLLVNSNRVSAASRPRLYWVDARIEPMENERLHEGSEHNTLTMCENPHRLEILDPGYRFHPRFAGTLACLTGWNPQGRPPKTLWASHRPPTKQNSRHRSNSLK